LAREEVRLIKTEEKETQQMHNREIKVAGAVANAGNQRSKQQRQRPARAAAAIQARSALANAIPPLMFSSGVYEVMNPGTPAQEAKLRAESQTQTATAINTGTASSSAIHTGNVYVDSMFSGMSTSTSRMPDPYTSVRTFTTSVMTNGTISPNFPSSPPSTFGGFAMMVNGSGLKTIGYPHLDATAIAGDVAIDWTGTTMTIYNGGINSPNFVTRPSGISLCLDVHSIGPVHDIVINAFPILPMSLTYASGASIYGWPAYLSNGLTALQSTWGGRTWTVPSNGRLSFAFSPMDNRSFDFEAGNAERGAYDALGQIAWGGWVIWGWGMTEGDRILLRMVFGEECALVTASTTAFAYPTSRNPANPTAAAAAKDEYSGLLDKGFGAIEYLYDKMAPTASKIYSFLTDDNSRPLAPNGTTKFDFGADSGCNFTGFMNCMPVLSRGGCAIVPRPIASMSRKGKSTPPDELKNIEDCDMPHLSVATRTVNALTDPPEIVTPLSARRPSIAKSLTGRRCQ